jgi:hypothetical protein
MRLRMALGASLLMSHFGCAPCPPGGFPCARIYVVSAAASQPVTDATVMITVPPPSESFSPTRSCTGQQDGCYTPLTYLAGCTGSFRIRVEHPSFQPFEQRFTAPIGRQYECAEASYRIDVRLTPR